MVSKKRQNIKKLTQKNFYLKRKTPEDMFSSLLYKKLIGLIMKNGKKTLAIKIVNSALKQVKKQSKFPLNYILYKVFRSLKTSIEIRKIKIRRSFHLVPFPVKKERKTFLASKWIIASFKKIKNKKTFEKLATVLNNILKKKKVLALSIKKFHIRKSLENRSNMHFRW
jgi:small subunit ribosomal protein S7